MLNRLILLFVVIGLGVAGAAKAGEVKEITPGYLVEQYRKMEKTGTRLAATLPLYLKTMC